jgi:uncharacterized lipoprotein NlpE involved in copper resistance
MKKYLLMALISMSLVGCSQKTDEEKQFVYNENTKYISFEYKITRIGDDGFYGDSTTDKSGVFFTNDNVRTGTNIQVGDIVEAIFEADNQGEGIVEVVKN